MANHPDPLPANLAEAHAMIRTERAARPAAEARVGDLEIARVALEAARLEATLDRAYTNGLAANGSQRDPILGLGQALAALRSRCVLPTVAQAIVLETQDTLRV